MKAREAPQANHGGGSAEVRPFALFESDRGMLRLTAVSGTARAQGVHAGQPLADARALLPALVTRPAEPEADARTLRALADWSARYTPWTNVAGRDGLWLDITGCAHLFGGEAALIEDLCARLRAFGFAVRPGLAGTPGAAWAVARFAADETAGRRIVAPGAVAQALSPLPVAALRLEPEALVLLRRLGLRSIGDLNRIPRIALARRFRGAAVGDQVLTRLDQALGTRDEPLQPLQPTPAYRASRHLATPIVTPEGIETALRTLLARLCDHLAGTRKGARALILGAYRVDGRCTRIRVAASRPTHDSDHFRRLFAEHLEGIDPGFGIETMILEADLLHALEDRQLSLNPDDAAGAEDDLLRLVDRLANRLGPARVRRLVPRESHIPERAEARVPAQRTDTSEAKRRTDRAPRPFRLLARPEPIHVLAEIPEGPPMRFVWRRVVHRTARTAGPERLAPEWWLEAGCDYDRVRDYYRVEDTEGRRFWLYREGLYQLTGPQNPPRWFVHGLFA